LNTPDGKQVGKYLLIAKVKNIELISFASADELASRAASAWLNEIEAAKRAGKTHCVALSGGRITQKFFAATVEQAKARAVSFERVHFFWADERCVPPTDPESNFKLASEFLFAPLKISANQIHRIRGEDSPQAAVETKRNLAASRRRTKTASRRWI
jgi:6-phosphogluconolactonase